MDKNHINLCLSGQSFRIVTDDDVDYVKQLEKRINSRIESYKKRYPQMSATRCTLLAMLELEDEPVAVQNVLPVSWVSSVDGAGDAGELLLLRCNTHSFEDTVIAAAKTVIC